MPNGPTRTRPGSPCPDAALYGGYLLDHLIGEFTLLALNIDSPKTSIKTVTPVQITPTLRDRHLGDRATLRRALKTTRTAS